LIRGLSLDKVLYQILDEGDKMLDMGFQEDIEEIQTHLSDESKSMIFSATVPKFIQNLAIQRLKDPVLIDLVGDSNVQIPDKITHKAVICDSEKQKIDLVLDFLEENPKKKVIIFTETKDEAKHFQKLDKKSNLFILTQGFLVLHGDIEQASRE